MRTVRKALNLLDVFSETASEFGLSELARNVGYDKATTQRMLAALTDHGMLEQHPQTKKYRLGAELLRLARVREATFPISEIVEPTLKKLAQQTGETAHFSLASGSHLATLGIADSPRANRINIEKGERLPLHCTGSGIAFLAFSPDSLVNEILNQPLEAPSDKTVTDPKRIRQYIAAAKKTAIGTIDEGYEAEVVGYGAPIFDWTGFASGAVAVALPSSRNSPQYAREIKSAVRKAAVEITRGFGAEPDEVLLRNEPIEGAP
jgi:IclR family transcriptional regulator, acetate operon repressor